MRRSPPFSASRRGGPCRACRLNRTIPGLDDPERVRWWRTIEIAERRRVSQLLGLGLPVRSRLDEDPPRGLMFDFLRAARGGAPVRTGHASGLITLDVEPCDAGDADAARFLGFVNAWLELTTMLNEMSRRMGPPGFCSFVPSRPEVAKLYFVHRVVVAAAGH